MSFKQFSDLCTRNVKIIEIIQVVDVRKEIEKEIFLKLFFKIHDRKEVIKMEIREFLDNEINFLIIFSFNIFYIKFRKFITKFKKILKKFK